jgi:Icc-related predicted phosphoesterase
MILCAAGDIHGALDRLFDDVLRFEAAARLEFDWVLHVGDFGIWPDPDRVDKATRRHDGAGDFPRWWREQRAAPRKTVFIKGNHEDFEWLDARESDEVLPNLFYLRNGRVRALEAATGALRVGGVGGCFGPSNYERPSAELRGYSKRHYTADEIEALSTDENVDILLVHDAPAGVRFERHRQGAGYVSEARGLDELVRRARPRVCFFGHHHTRIDAEIANVRCIGLNKVARSGKGAALF